METYAEDCAEDTLIALFERTFTASEGAEEGAAIAALVRALTVEATARPLLALDGDAVIAAIFFSPLQYGSGQQVWLLSPVAVAPERQGAGVGTRLIRRGLEMLSTQRADAVVTYGDPAFYGRVGFQAVSTLEVPAPYPLSMPIGWIAQALGAEVMPKLLGPATPVPAFADPALW